ncbi:MAG: sigma-54-dependent Fis family transcriptional regulator [Ignavibacteriales bacterium]|nr:sigma-54-dependent Fis family transcriptional regulator [Ignavibacteriales bacterium]
MQTESAINVLLIEDEEFDVRRVKNTIEPFRDRINLEKIVSNGNDALATLGAEAANFHVVIMDFQIAGGLMGEALISKIRENDSAIQIIVITKMTVNITDYHFANRLLKAGAFWYCTKYPGDIEDYIYQPTDFILSIFNAFEKCRLERERIYSNQKFIKTVRDILNQKKLIGEHPSILKLREEIRKYSQSNVSIFIRGSSGTGKELVAFNLHYNSPRCLENFVPINCGSLPNDLIESELFGYEKGAFTGADKRKSGLFEIANKGTIFLDEITELPLTAQVKLLRVLQEGELEKIGRTEKIKVDVRVIAASNRNIEEEVRAKRFREDLYYRLNVVPLYVPSLKQRFEDIPILLDYFMNNIGRDMGIEKPKIEKEAMEALQFHPWPGNVRELKNVAQRFFFLDEHVITKSIALNCLGSFTNESDDGTTDNEIPFTKGGEIVQLREVERSFREKYFTFVRNHSGSDTEAARKMGLAPPNYYRMAKELGLK